MRKFQAAVGVFAAVTFGANAYFQFDHLSERNQSVEYQKDVLADYIAEDNQEMIPFAEDWVDDAQDRVRNTYISLGLSSLVLIGCTGMIATSFREDPKKRRLAPASV